MGFGCFALDDIQQKLALIDKQLAGGFVNFHKQIISTAPLLFAGVGFIAGILLQNVFDLPIIAWLTLLSLFVIVTVIFFIIQRSLSTNYQLPVFRQAQDGEQSRTITNYRYAMAYLALVCFTCLGGVRLISFHRPKADDIRNLIGGERRLATIRGRIVTRPYKENRQWEFAKFRFTDPASSFYLKIQEVETTAGWAEVGGTVRVQVAEPLLDLKAGDYIQLYCWLDRFKEATNPGQFDAAKYLARKNVFIAASVKSRDGIELLESGGGVFTRIKGKMREAATQALLGDLSIEDRSRGLLEALLLGYRGNIDSKTYNAFRKTGLLHFISLSGMHLGILIGIIWWLCKTAGLLKRGRAAICIIAIGVFLLIVPPRAPTIRAAIIVFVFCVSFFFRRKSNPVNTLSLAAIILLLIRPTCVFEAGWQLSFASVLGIILFTGRIEFFIYEKVTDWFRIKERQKTKASLRIILDPLSLFAIGLAAWLGGAGILLYHFYTINPLTSIWTVIVFLPVVGILTVGFLKIILSFLLPSIATILGVLVTGLAEFLIRIVQRIASWGISEILVGQVSSVPIILYYCFVLFAGFVYFRRPLIKKVISVVMVLAVIAFVGVTKWQRTHRDKLVLTTLDVGHGQAIVAQLPGGTNVLFDTGSLHKSDIGRRIVAPFLDYSGVSKIDCIVISHNDVDHINGIPEIVEHCNVNGVYANSAFLDRADKWGTAQFLEQSLRKEGLEIQPLGKKLPLSSKAKVKILWPTEQVLQNEKLGDNDRSAVALIEFAGTEVLLCSDIGEFAQGELLRLYPELKAEVVVVPHHGSSKTADPNFLQKLEADISICSCSRSQYERTNRTPNKARSLYTARDGAIAVCINKDGTIKLVSRD
jgi:competence protein ComEC